MTPGVAHGLRKAANILDSFRGNYDSTEQGEELLQEGLAEMVKLIMDVENARLGLNSETLTYLVNPIEALLTVDLKNLRVKNEHLPYLETIESF